MVRSAKKILIIDDEPDIQAYLQAALEDAGYEICTPTANQAFIDTVRQEKPDLICLDIMMPQRTGISFYKQLSASDEFRQIPIILVTGMIQAKQLLQEELARMAQVGGPTVSPDIIDKPVNIPELLRLIQSALERKQ